MFIHLLFQVYLVIMNLGHIIINYISLYFKNCFILYILVFNIKKVFYC